MSQQQAASKLGASIRGRLARRHLKDDTAKQQDATALLTRYRVWDEMDGAAKGWRRRSTGAAAQRHQKYGNFSLGDMRPCNSIWSIDWTAALNFKRSDGGRSSGVYFVVLPGNQLVVVKPDDEVVADYCGYLLACFFRVDHPEMRVVKIDSSEGAAIRDALERLDGEKPLSQRASPPIREVLAGVPSVLVMNFVRGRSLKGLAISGMFDPDSRDVFMARAFGKGELNEAGRISLRHIGRMMAFDILIFNYDRLPCVFQNGGNTENVMIADDGSVVAIDSMISGFDISNPAAREQFEAFLKRVGALVASTLAAPTTPLAEFSAVRELLLKGRGDESSEAYCPPLAYDIGDEGVREIQSGFLSCLRDFDQLPAHAFEQLPRLVQAFLGEDGYGAGRCDPEFLDSIAKVFQRRGKVGDDDAIGGADTPSAGTLIRYGDHQMAFHAKGAGTLQRLGSSKVVKKSVSTQGGPTSAAAPGSGGGGGGVIPPPCGWTSASLAVACYEALGMCPPSGAVAQLPKAAVAPRMSIEADTYLTAHRADLEKAIASALAATLNARADAPLAYLVQQLAHQAGLEVVPARP